MHVLVTDPETGVWDVTPRDGMRRQIPCDASWPCMPCAHAGCMALCCMQTQDCLCLSRREGCVLSRMPAVPGVAEIQFSPCGRYLYQLSAEADCIHTRCTATGELLFAAPCGVMPRMMMQDASGKRLLAAGGAVNEAYVFAAPELTLEQTIHTRHPCFGACFWREGLVLVCAVEGEDIHTAVYTLAPGKVRPRKLTELPGMMGAICVCPDGRHMLISTRDGLMKLSLESGALLWNREEWPLAMRLHCRGGQMLISDTLDGSVCVASHDRPWEKRQIFHAAAAQACFW